ncbi:MAG: hypothetical protein IT342_02440, partial [Candidatus Melainabacteria bacterium]|nr:hypothetical protein [Candidatus Melainabacteria bacterium]
MPEHPWTPQRPLFRLINALIMALRTDMDTDQGIMQMNQATISWMNQ